MICLILLIFSSLASSQDQNVAEFLRVMTFNIWNSANNVYDGEQKVTEHILQLKPDIVALQEVYRDGAQNIAEMLGNDWDFAQAAYRTYPDTAILTRHRIVPGTMFSTRWGVGCDIVLESGKLVHFWNAHLDYVNYGPSAALNRHVKNVAEILRWERESERESEILNVLNLAQFKKWMSESAETPIVLCGDFNSPSHLDWIEANKYQHGGWVVEWPVTKHLQNYGFIDSYRINNPDVMAQPGMTWSTVHRNDVAKRDDYSAQPFDRMDFIFYKGKLSVISSSVHSGNQTIEPVPDYQDNDYPSDHFAVLTDFQFV